MIRPWIFAFLLTALIAAAGCSTTVPTGAYRIKWDLFIVDRETLGNYRIKSDVRSQFSGPYDVEVLTYADPDLTGLENEWREIISNVTKNLR
jgi:hypothetical protein